MSFDRRCFLPLLMVAFCSHVAIGDPIVAGSTSWQARAIQDVTLFANTAVNPSPDELFIDDLFGDATAGINRATQVGDEIVISSVSGWDFVGSLPGIGDYRFGAVGPFGGADFTGTITDVVQDMNDPGFSSGDPSSFVSGTAVLSGESFAFEFLSGPLAGVILTTDPSQDFSFTASLDGLPPSPGVAFTNVGDESLNVLFNGQIVGTSTDRRVVTVPEPESAVLSLFALLMVIARTHRSHRSKQ